MRAFSLALALILAFTPTTARGRSGLAAQSPKTPAINGPLTLIAWQGSDPALDNSIVTVGSDGALTPLIRPKACCELASVDWAPGGRRLAFVLGCVGCGPQAAPGIYVAVAATGSQRRILGGFEFDLDWSPDGSRLAYVRFRHSSNSQGSIYVVKTNGSDPRVIDTGTAGHDSSPSWSPNGARLAFASAQGGLSSVSVIDLDGSHRALIAANASEPAWSPNGNRIALSACGGIELFTPSGKDVTPGISSSGCRAIGVAGAPVWSPDGRQIAIKAKDGLYTMSANGADLRKVTTDTGGGMFGVGKPTWRPIPRVRLLAEAAGFAAARRPLGRSESRNEDALPRTLAMGRNCFGVRFNPGQGDRRAPALHDHIRRWRSWRLRLSSLRGSRLLATRSPISSLAEARPRNGTEA
jgi:WD40-like Beta Propeller Repeat